MAETKRGVKSTKNKCTCFYCGNEYVDTNYYKSNSEFYINIGIIPYCKQCIEKFYQYYFEKYTNEGCLTPERKAVKRLCMAFDIYYIDNIFDSSMKKIKESNMNISPMGQYMKTIQLRQYNRNRESYENTITQEEQEELVKSLVDMSNISDREIDESTIKFFGVGFSDEDYKFLKEQYDDWVARHECKTKAQE